MIFESESPSEAPRDDASSQPSQVRSQTPSVGSSSTPSNSPSESPSGASQEPSNVVSESPSEAPRDVSSEPSNVPPAVLLTQSRSQSPSEVDVSSEPSSMTLLVLFEALDAGFWKVPFLWPVWISTSTVTLPPGSRDTKQWTIYVLVDGSVVSESFAALTLTLLSVNVELTKQRTGVVSELLCGWVRHSIDKDSLLF